MSGKTYQFTQSVEFQRWSENAQGFPERSTCNITEGTPFTVAYIPTYGVNPNCELRIERNGVPEALKMPWTALQMYTNYSA